MRVTVSSLATQLGVDYGVANSLLKYMQLKGVAKEVDKVKTSGKGKPSTVYEIPETFTIDLSAKKAEVA